jgi:hypothetical protein
MIIPKTLVVALIAGCCWFAQSSHALAGGSTPTAPQNLASYDWSVSASPNLAAKPPRKEVVQSFLRSSVETYDDVEGQICSFRFADLQHNGNLSLVAGTDSSGRGLCNEVYIADKTRTGCEFYSMDGVAGEGSDVSKYVTDIGGDGHLEYLYEQELVSANHCVASWTVIYAWTGNGYKNVSDQFKEFYRHRLRSLDEKISAASATDASDEESDQVCLQAEAERIKKFLNVAPSQGLESAIKLASSKSPAERETSAYLLAGIGTPEARKYLESLQKDPDAAVADMGKYYLAELSTAPVPPPAEFQRVN